VKPCYTHNTIAGSVAPLSTSLRKMSSTASNFAALQRTTLGRRRNWGKTHAQKWNSCQHSDEPSSRNAFHYSNSVISTDSDGCLVTTVGGEIFKAGFRMLWISAARFSGVKPPPSRTLAMIAML
jgi:hypothetical protein